MKGVSGLAANIGIDLKNSEESERNVCKVQIQGSPEFILKLLGKE